MQNRLGSIERLGALWHDETLPATRSVCVAALVAGLVAAALVGRIGRPWAAAAAAALFMLALVPFVARWIVLRQRRRSPRALMSATLMRTEPELARAVLRAMDLSEQTAGDPRRGSAELARLHFARLLGRASLPALEARAGQAAWLASGTALVLAAVALVAVALDPFRFVEGADVLAARDGVAPWAVSWIEDTRVSAEPPSYLDQSRRSVRPHFPTALHVGTVLTVRGEPVHEGRQLVLTDGEREVAFADDGDGALVARWTVEEDASLMVAARFGEVIVREPRGLDVQAIVDHAPFVRLDGAPATRRLLEEPRIPIHWEVLDDHGIREVALVLRAGDREVRRELSTPQGSSLADRGGIELRADDPFLDESYLPVEVSVHALDNDPVSGPKWGRSASLIVLPPQIGEREAMRYQALKNARAQLTDLLAARLTAKPSGQASAYLKAERASQDVVSAAFEEALQASFGGIRLGGRVAALSRGQLEKMDKAFKKAEKLPPALARETLVEATEDALLAIDSALRALGRRDTRSAALELSEVAMHTAASIALGRAQSERERADQLFAAHLEVLRAGGGHLVELGDLGRDLGGIVQSGVRRIERPFEREDRHHARLAAEDLAARLRRPDPSFGAGGGGHGHGGVESGGMGQPGQGEPSEAAEQMRGLEQALEQLRQEHEQQMGEVDQALRDAMPAEERQAMQQRLDEAARKVREAVKDLPDQAADPASARAASAQAKSEAESMAGAMERADLNEALRQGTRALESLQRAERRGEDAPRGSSERAAGEAAGEAHGKLEELMQEGREALEQLRQSTSEQAREQLREAAEREGELAERARELRRQSQDSEAPLPGSMLERLEDAARKMEDASRSLERGEGSKGQEQQREAQRLLEMSQPEQEQESSQRQDGEGKDFARDADVPPEARDKRADDFRKRVTEGLGREAPPHLREALRRYTEGLLR